MLKKLFTLIIFLSALILSAQENFPDEINELLRRSQKPVLNENWALLNGKLTHRRREKPDREHQIRLALRFTPEMIFAQIIIDNKESYFVTQGYAYDATTVIKEGNPESNILQETGIRPEELTLSFLFWTPEAYLGNETFKTTSCAKIAMKSPDKKEKAVILLNREYAFPLKVEWFLDGEEKARRTMEVSSFKKEDNLWFVDEIMLYGPGWRSKISFDRTEAGSAEKGAPKDLFIRIP